MNPQGTSEKTAVEKCPGTLIWHDVEAESSALLECSGCDYVIVAGSFFDERHQGCEILRAGLGGA